LTLYFLQSFFTDTEEQKSKQTHKTDRK